jgi:hypothetical protein
MNGIPGRLGATVLCATLAAAQAALAQQLTCDDIEFLPDVIHEFPSVGQACHSVVERDGQLYVRLVADVVKVRTDGTVVIDIKARDGTRFRQEFNPPPGFRVRLSGTSSRTRDLVRGQEIRLYLPSNQWQVRQGPS